MGIPITQRYIICTIDCHLKLMRIVLAKGMGRKVGFGSFDEYQKQI